MSRGPSEVFDAVAAAREFCLRVAANTDELGRVIKEKDDPRDWWQLMSASLFISGAAGAQDPNAGLLWVSAEMQDLLSAAAPTMPDRPLVLDSLPWRQAFVVLEKSINVTVNENGQETTRACRALGWISLPRGAVEQGLTNRPAVWTCWYKRDPAFPTLLIPWCITTWPEREPAEGPYDDAYQVQIQRLLACLWSMVQQRIALVSPGRASRSEARRFQRATKSDEIPSFSVVRLRRPHNATEPCEDPRVVNWSHRWIVGGHWRNQFFPSMGEHVPMWIAPYVKGPENKPLIIKDKVHAWVR